MVSAVQEYHGLLISVNNSNDETLSHTEDYYFLINFSVLLRYFLFLNYFLDYFLFPTYFSFLNCFPNYFSVISHFSSIYGPRTADTDHSVLTMLPDPFSHPHKEKWEKAVWLCETNLYLATCIMQVMLIYYTTMHFMLEVCNKHWFHKNLSNKITCIKINLDHKNLKPYGTL